MGRLCLIEDDPIMGESLADRFALEQVPADWFRSAEEASEALAARDYAVVVCDIRLPGVSGDRLFERLIEQRAVVPSFVFITGYGQIERAVHLLKIGAADYLTKPFDLDHLIERVRALGAGAGAAGGEGTLGVSAAMQRIEDLLVRLARVDETVLILGETGSGKEVVARHLHEIGRRARPFVAVNCAALVEGLAESELFGHEKGAFTGAIRTHQGVFERAADGTLFLDEIGDMPLALQAKLLRVLQDRAVVRVGGGTPVLVSARVVVATHQDLRERVADGGFREDLFYRLNVVSLTVPPLRERPEDTLWLANRFLAEIARKRGQRRLQLGPDAERALREYPWPGNVRELRHTLERASLFAAGERLGADDLFGGPASALAPAGQGEKTLDEYLSSCEREYIRNRLAENDGRIAATAAQLGISRKSLWERMKRLAIRSEDEGLEGRLDKP